MLHAETEEEVLYLATILIGEFLRAKLRIVSASEEYLRSLSLPEIV
jgi:hypothetical protein